jgi:Leucine-rich repeat (LRR) protein
LQQLVVNYTEISSLKPISRFFQLTRLDVKHTKIDDNSVGFLKDFKKLQILDLLNTNITRLPELDLPDLLLLDIRKTKLKSIRPLLPLLKGRPGVDGKPDRRGMDILEVDQGIVREAIVIDRSIPFENPGLEVILSGRQAVLDYLTASVQGTDYLYEAKIVIVGAGEAGKTTLVRKLKNPSHPVPNTDDKRTEGILIEEYPFEGQVKGENAKKNMVAHVWDFGGQELYYTTHQLFLTEDTLYLLLNDNRKNDTDFYYWLNVVTLRAGDSCPILTVFNAKEGAQRTVSLDNKIFDPFKGLIRAPVDVDFAKNDDRLRHLIKTIQAEFCNLEVLGRKLPINWVRVRKALHALPDDYIDKARFKEICLKNEVKEESQMDTLLEIFHKLGIVLHFSKIRWLENLVILKSKWCTDAVYKALDKDFIQQQHGRFDEARLSQIWSEARYRGRERDLLAIMEQFNLCYRVSEDTYIAPQLLDLKPKYLPNFPTEGLIRYRYRYAFMPNGILTQFIAKMGRHIYDPYVWHDGVTLRWEEGTVAEVIENQITREIDIRIAGPGKKVRLIDIQAQLSDVNQVFRGLAEEQFILCNCPDCSTAEKPTEFSLEEVQDNARNGDPLICRNGERKRLNAQQVLDGIYENQSTIVAEAEKHLAQGHFESLRAAAQCLSKLPAVRKTALVLEGTCSDALRPDYIGVTPPNEMEQRRKEIAADIVRLLDFLRRDDH